MPPPSTFAWSSFSTFGDRQSVQEEADECALANTSYLPLKKGFSIMYKGLGLPISMCRDSIIFSASWSRASRKWGIRMCLDGTNDDAHWDSGDCSPHNDSQSDLLIGDSDWPVCDQPYCTLNRMHSRNPRSISAPLLRALKTRKMCTNCASEYDNSN